jgi:RNA 3'-terminal phosphate cyclase (ATP)
MESVARLSGACRIDGSFGEGGGQILRNAAALAGLLQKNLVVENIRAGRKNPGLRAQHAACLRLVADLCGGTLEGSEVGSTTFRYRPPSTEDGAPVALGSSFQGDIGTAGSVCLLLQAALPCALLSRSSASHAEPVLTLELQGGTNATLAPQYDYWELVFLPTVVSCFGLKQDQVSSRVIRRGFYPRGGGRVLVTVEPNAARQRLRTMDRTERGSVESIFIRAFHAGTLPRHVAQVMADAAMEHLRANVVADDGRKNHVEWTIRVETETSAVGTASGILVVARTSTGCLLAGSALGNVKQSSRVTGKGAAEELHAALREGGCVDDWLQDQLILYMALADGVSTLLVGSLTLHTRTAMWVAERLTGASFEVERVSADPGHVPQAHPLSNKSPPSVGEDLYGSKGRIQGKHLIRCHGIGFQPR